jgi:hypothetical protein
VQALQEGGGKVITVDQMIKQLKKKRKKVGGDCEVFVGNYYADVPALRVIIEDGYVLVDIGSEKDIT